MPTTKLKNAVYRLALPFMAPQVKGRMESVCEGHNIDGFEEYEKLLEHHHVLGSSFMLKDGDDEACVYTSLKDPVRKIDSDSLFRIASITKTLTAIVTMRLCEKGAFSLKSPVASLIEGGESCPVLDGVTVENILCHTSGIVDTPQYEKSAANSGKLYDVLSSPGIRANNPGRCMVYSNFAFGMLGSVLESVCKKSISRIFDEELLTPLHMRGSFTPVDNEQQVVPISRVLPYERDKTVTLTSIGRRKMTSPDPEHHYACTAGGFYTDCRSLSHVLTMLTSSGEYDGKQYLREESVRNMMSLHASTAERKYGLGLVLLERSNISGSVIVGHQGFAYGCVDGMFAEKDTGRQVIMLNGGASELREGRLAVINRDLLSFGIREMSKWHR